jgi:regulator of sirC expression with transglutaminase-like and TPR domain
MSEAAEQFAEVVQGPDAALPLDLAALLLAAATKPDPVDVDGALATLDAIADEVPAPTLDGLRQLLFRDLGFGGNPDDYYDPANSWLDDVLERRVGIPISLAVVMMEVGRRIAVPLWGVSMPGHFLVRDKVDPEVFVDPFMRGKVLDRDGCAARFHAVQGPGSVFDESFLEPVGRAAILVRMLANLETVATMRSDRDLLQRVLELRVVMPDAGLVEHRKLAAALATSGRYLDAANVLETYAGRDVDDAVTAIAVADKLRAKLN